MEDERAEAARMVGWLCVTIAVVCVCMAAAVAMALDSAHRMFAAFVVLGIGLLISGACALRSARKLESQSTEG